jgi:hypothetical protein
MNDALHHVVTVITSSVSRMAASFGRCKAHAVHAQVICL